MSIVLSAWVSTVEISDVKYEGRWFLCCVCLCARNQCCGL